MNHRFVLLSNCERDAFHLFLSVCLSNALIFLFLPPSIPFNVCSLLPCFTIISLLMFIYQYRCKQLLSGSGYTFNVSVNKINQLKQLVICSHPIHALIVMVWGNRKLYIRLNVTCYLYYHCYYIPSIRDNHFSLLLFILPVFYAR